MPEWLTIVFRSLGAILFLFLLTRLLGKKQISQLTFFEYITGITLGELAGFISTELEAHYMYGILALLVWTLVPLSIEFGTLKSKRLRNWVEGKATILVKDGKVLEDNLKKERYSSDELLEQLRMKDVFRVADVEFAVLESNGDVSVLLKKEFRPLTPNNMGIKVSPDQEPQTVIMDGEIMDEPLATIGLSRDWLLTELEIAAVAVENVFLAQVDASGELYIDLYDDQIKVPAPQKKALLLALLKKCEADLELFALAADNMSAKQMYGECALKLGGVLHNMTPILKR